MNSLEQEIEWRKANDMEIVSVEEMTCRFAALGYTLDRSKDCRSIAHTMTGPRSGTSYPCCTTGAKEADTGIGYAQTGKARRDANYRAFQELRGKCFAISHGAILCV